MLALDEFNELKKKYELEIECRKKAEDIASEVIFISCYLCSFTYFSNENWIYVVTIGC